MLKRQTHMKDNVEVISMNKKRRAKKDFVNYAWAYFMIAPTMIGLFVLNIWPVFKTMYLSFTTTEGFNNTRWVGNANYVKLIGDTAVWQSTWNTILFTLIVVPVGVFLSLVVAALLNSKIKGKGIYRTIYFLPMVVAPAAVALLWKWLFNADYGLINYTLSVFGINGIQWLTDPKYALLSVCIVGIWSTLGYNMVILLAGLQNIPGTYYEAADIDGAGAVQKFFFITVPMVSPTLFFVVITQIMAALKQFDLVYMMADETNPALESVRTILYLFYENAFVVNDKGYASAIVVLAFLIIMVVTAIQFWLQKKWVHYE